MHYCLHSTDWCKIVNVDCTASWQRNTIRLLSELETEGIKWIYICLYVRCFINCSTVAISATVSGENTCIVLVFIYIMKMEAERLSATFIPYYGSNDLENQNIKTWILFESLHEAGEISCISNLKFKHGRLTLCTHVMYAALRTHMLYPFDLKPKPTTRVICISNELCFLHERAVKYLTTL